MQDVVERKFLEARTGLVTSYTVQALDTTLVYEKRYPILADTVGVVLLGSTNHSGW